MYGKLFESMYRGTLAEDWKALVTFQQMIIMSDQDGTIDVTPSHISRITGIPIEVVLSGIEALELPDPRSRTPDEEGKRIIRLDDHRDWGWYIVNHEKYKQLVDSDEIREQNRERKRKQRAREKESQNVTACHECHGKSRHIDVDINNKDICDSKKPNHPAMSKSEQELILNLFREICPERPQPTKSLWHGSASANQLTARWKQDKAFQTEQFWRTFFETVAASDWWMGRNEKWPKGVDMHWLVKKTNFAKVVEEALAE